MFKTSKYEYENQNDEAQDLCQFSITNNSSHDVPVPETDTSRRTVTSEDSEEHKCGVLCCQPSWAHIFVRPKWFLVVMLLFAFVHGFVVNGVSMVNATSYERRFQLTAQQVGLIASAYDFSAGIFVLPLSYYGSFVHKPRLLGFAALALGVGSLIMALPHIVTENYEAGEQVNKLCNATETTYTTVYRNTHLSNFLYLFIFGQILNGVAGAILYTVGIGTLDDNVNNKTSPLHLGSFRVFASLGPGFGYICGGKFLDLYVDFDQRTSVDLSQDDPRWVGAWWLGFLISFVPLLIIACLLFMFPRELPYASQLLVDRAETNPDGQVHQHKSIKKATKEIPAATLRLLKNLTFVFISFSCATEGLLEAGLSTFFPKIIKNQFNQTDSIAAIITGAIVVPGAAGGHFFGGYIIHKTGWGVKGMLRFIAVMCLGVLAFSGVLFARCEQNKVSGVNIPYDLNTTTKFSVNLESACNKDCGCNVEHYDPLCINDIEYFTPCYAGCRDQEIVYGKKNYFNCTCVSTHMAPLNTTLHGVAGRCGTTCVYLYVFIGVFVLVILFTFLAGTPAISATFRCVSDRDKIFALGVQAILWRSGATLGPLIVGAIMDSACVFWQTNSGINKSCWIYDNEAMSRNLFLIILVAKSLSILFLMLASCLYKHTNCNTAYKNEVKVNHSDVVDTDDMRGSLTNDLSETTF